MPGAKSWTRPYESWTTWVGKRSLPTETKSSVGRLKADLEPVLNQVAVVYDSPSSSETSTPPAAHSRHSGLGVVERLTAEVEPVFTQAAAVNSLLNQVTVVYSLLSQVAVVTRRRQAIPPRHTLQGPSLIRDRNCLTMIATHQNKSRAWIVSKQEWNLSGLRQQWWR